MFLDASAIVAILIQEEGWESFEFKTASAVNIVTSPVSVHETVLGVARKLSCGLGEAQTAAERFFQEAGAIGISIDTAIGRQVPQCATAVQGRRFRPYPYRHCLRGPS